MGFAFLASPSDLILNKKTEDRRQKTEAPGGRIQFGAEAHWVEVFDPPEHPPGRRL
jgi:hypothetical protein